MTNFIHIKYKPTNLQNFYILHDIKNKLLKLSNNKHLNNIILYGNNGSCKKTLLLCYLNNYFNNSNIIYNTKVVNFTLSNNYNLFYKCSSKHFEFCLIDNSYTNKLIILEILYELVKSKSIINQNTIIIIFNIHKLYDYFSLIKHIIEKYTNIIVLGTSNTYINKSSIFMQLKVNTLNYFDFLKLSLNIKNDFNLQITNKNIKNFIYESNYDINILLNLYQNIINHNLLKKQSKINYNIDIKFKNTNYITDIINILIQKNINDFYKIKNIINNILIYKYYNIDSIINIIFNKIIIFIKDKHNFVYNYTSLTNNIYFNNDINNIILLDTLILCIYKYI